MKRVFILISIMFTCVPAFSQKKQNTNPKVDSIVKMFTWDIKETARGKMMFLDVPYQRDNSDSTEYLTLTVAKDKSNERPAFISIIIPNNVVQSNGIFIKFSNSVKAKDGTVKMELDKEKPVRALFENCGDETCTARIVDAYLTDEKSTTKTDILQRLLNSDHVLFLFIYSDGSHKSVAVPLFSFKQQYKSL